MEDLQIEQVLDISNDDIVEQLNLLNDNVYLILEYIMRLNAYNLMLLAILILITFFVGMKAGK